MKLQLKTTALRLLRVAGGFELVARSRWRRERLLILCYHGFSLRDEHRWDPGLFVTAEHLDRRLTHLANGGYTVLPLGEGLKRLHSGALPPRAVVITVDDGNHDFHAVALPVFTRHRMPATVYASTYHVLDQRPVFNVMVSYLLWRAGQNGHRLVAGFGAHQELAVADRADAFKSAAAVRELAAGHGWTADDKHEYLGRLAEEAGEDWGSLLEKRLLSLMTLDELRGLPGALVDVQLHTHRHRTPRELDAFHREIQDNRLALAQAGCDPAQLVHFCYPSGDHHPEFLPWLAAAGVRSATTCVPGLARSGTNPLLLPRFIDTSTTADVEFEAWCSGLRGILRRPQRQFSAG